MGVGTLISAEEYLRTSYHPDCHYVDGEVIERNAGQKNHSYAQTRIAAWFVQRIETLRLEPFTELRAQVRPHRFRVPDVLVSGMPSPEEQVFTSPPYLCIEIMSPDDTIGSLQDVLDDYLAFGVPNVWVIDPWKHRGWAISAAGWATATDGVMRTSDGLVDMPLAEVLPPTLVSNPG
jgi:Uma2 family endonuclease